MPEEKCRHCKAAILATQGDRALGACRNCYRPHSGPSCRANHCSTGATRQSPWLHLQAKAKVEQERKRMESMMDELLSEGLTIKEARALLKGTAMGS